MQSFTSMVMFAICCYFADCLSLLNLQHFQVYFIMSQKTDGRFKGVFKTLSNIRDDALLQKQLKAFSR